MARLTAIDKFKNLFNVLSHSIKLLLEEDNIVRTLFKEVHLKKGDFFLTKGEVCDKLGFVCRGVFRYYIEDEDKTYNFRQGKGFYLQL